MSRNVEGGPATPVYIVNDTLPSSSGGVAGLTDTQLRATAVPVSGPLTDTQLRALALAIKLSGELKTLLAPTTIIADAATAYAAMTGLDIYSRAAIQLIISAKTMDASTTLNIYIQRSVDGGTNWDDIASFAQVTSAAMANGTYMLGLMLTGSAQIDRIKSDGALAANTVASIASWGDRLRVKAVSVNFAGTDTITIALTSFMVP